MVSRTAFIIYGQPRTGSSLLRDLLDSHPNVRCENEILNPKFGRVAPGKEREIICRDPRRLLAKCRSESESDAYGCKLLAHQVRAPHHVFAELLADGWRIIHIQRRDIFHQAVSYVQASRSGRWVRHSDVEHEEDDVIDAAEFLKIVKRLVRLRARERDVLRELPRLPIIYEDGLLDSADWQRTADSIFRFLGVESAPVVSAMKKTSAVPPSERVPNYDELVECIRRSDYLAPLLENRR